MTSKMGLRNFMSYFQALDLMINITHNMDAAAKEYGHEGNYVMGANIAGFKKVVEAMQAQGIV